jgi:type I restriction enzyme S subunit
MENLLPKLRFPEFDNNWKIKRLKEVTSYVDYRGRAPIKTSSGNFLVTAKNIKKGYIDYDISKEYVSENNYLNVMSKGLPELGDVLFTTEAPMGNVAQVDNKNIALAQRVIKFRGNDELSNDYLLHYMLSDNFQNLISEKSIGTTVQGISGKELHNINISFPSVNEQTKIANFFSSIDEKLKLLKEKKSLIENYKKGIMQKIFNQEIRFKDDNGIDFEKWQEKSLGEIGSVLNGLTYSPDDISEEGVLVLRSSNIKDSRLKFEDNVYVNKDNFTAVVENDVLICVRNGSRNLIGKNTLITKEIEGVAFGAFMSIYRSEFNGFLIHWFGSEDYFENVNLNLGATINSINGSDLKKFKVPFPCIAEQTKIADFLSSIDKKIELVTIQIEDSQEYKKGLLQQMFA